MCYTLDEIRDAVSSVVLEHNSAAPDDALIRSVSLFGSYARGAADDDSDVDLLVSFSSSAVSLFTLARVLEAMEGRLSVPVDLVQERYPRTPFSMLGRGCHSMMQPDKHVLEKILEEIAFLENLLRGVDVEDYPCVKSWILERMGDQLQGRGVIEPRQF